MRLCLANIKPSIAKKKKNLKKMEKTLLEEEADFFVFGELSLTGYICRDEFRDLAEPLDGPSVGAVQDMAAEHECTIVYGMPLEDRRGLISNAAIMVHADGTTGAYRKSFLPNFGPFEERFYFAPGREIPVFDTPWGTMGLCICYDLFFPELVKGLTLAGADMIICLSASPTVSQEFFECILPARAIENTVFMAYANLTGSHEQLEFWGGSQVYDPKGHLLIKSEYMKEGTVTTDIDFGLLKEARAARPTLRDTRAELFAAVHHIATGQTRLRGMAVIGLMMGTYAYERMSIEKVTLFGAEDTSDGIIFATGCAREDLVFEDSDRMGATFTSPTGDVLTLWLKDDVYQKVRRMIDTSLLLCTEPEDLFEQEAS